MEEKERYELLNDGCIYDNNLKQYVGSPCLSMKCYMKILADLLNQQDKRIKELEATNKVLSNELTKNSILKQDCIETCCGIPIYEIPKLKEENQQLKDQVKKAYQELEVAEKALNKMSNYAIHDNDLYDLVNDFNIGNERYDEYHFDINTCDIVDYFKDQAEQEIRGDELWEEVLKHEQTKEQAEQELKGEE